MTLKEFFAAHNKEALAFSGGVDSAYLLHAAMEYGAKVKAYFVKTPFQPQFELEDALRLQKELGCEMKIIELDVLDSKEITSNPANRCYFCKKKIFTEILKNAKEDGFFEVLDGTNASDDADDRPGMKVLLELSVYSPLRICGITKAEVRQLSKEAGLFTWDKPAYACLATRIPTGQEIDALALKRTEEAENFMFSLGFKNFRVRTRGDAALLQVTEEQLPLVISNRQQIFDYLKGLYKTVSLDMEVRGEQ